MSVLGGRELNRRIFEEDNLSKRLVITPLLSPSQIQEGSSSVDVRLGPHFLVHRRSNVAYLDPLNRNPHETAASRYQMEERIFTPFDKYFVMHPNQFVLGSTLEYLSVPYDLAGYVVGRSSWGRLGLITATAIEIHPGYKGVVTLELRNIGEVPFFLRPGNTIAQIFFHNVDGASPEEGVDTLYIGSTMPESSHLGPDEDTEIIRRLGLGSVLSGDSTV